MWPALLCGANFVLHSAGWLEGGLVMSYEKFVMDVEQCGAMHVLAAGLALDDNALAMDAFREVGPGNHFLGCEHTMRNYETAFYTYELSDNNSFEQWSEEGSLDLPRRANAKWKSLLAAHEPPALDSGLDDALRDFVARRKASMADAWY
jgi:trimethylamine--corrinoid protein Co-methyltransferase